MTIFMGDKAKNRGHLTIETINEIDELNKQAWLVHVKNPKLGLELSTKAMALSEQKNYPSGLAYATRNMGASNRYLSNLETALSLSFQAAEMFIDLGDKMGESQAYVSIGAIYYYMGDYQRGLDHFLKGLFLAEEIGHKEAMTYGYNGAGYIYSVLGAHEKALDFLNKALILVRELENFSLETSVLDSLAVAYLNVKQIDKAYETILATIALCERHNEKRNLGYALFGLGKIELLKNHIEAAKETFYKSLETHNGIGYKRGMADTLLQLGKIFFKEQNYEQANKYFQDTLSLADNIKAKAALFNVHEALAELSEVKKDIEGFVRHYKLFHQYKSEVFQEEQETKQKYLTLQHEMEKVKHESEINRLTNVVMKDKNAELEKKTQELEQSYNSVSVLSKIGQDITASLNLETILTTVYENVNELMDATVFGIGIYKPQENCIEYRMSIEKGKRYQPYRRTMEDKNQFPVWCIDHKKEVFINDIHREYSEYLPNIDMTILSSAEMEDGTRPENPISLIYIPLLVKDLAVGLLSVQSFRKNAYSHNHLNILRTLASYTAAALYNAQSFETLQNALNELKVTQVQLIQQEKMASLGELTAGIAHEIQNPLNFVNNFSDVNRELIAEMTAEIENGNFHEAKILARDIGENEKKIIHHGKRAEGIVKSMLQHSRNSSGEKEKTDLNLLTDEYLRLAYHGMRAKKKSFNLNIRTDFDQRIEPLEVIPQEIGRVILNLITNAFYAINDRLKNKAEKYSPELMVQTEKKDEYVAITVKDNAGGIPKNVRDKIFQPFFTTKPTGSGTGLGLSLSYDIIKAHGGEIQLKTQEGEGSEFTILLPTS